MSDCSSSIYSATEIDIEAEEEKDERESDSPVSSFYDDLSITDYEDRTVLYQIVFLPS